MVTGRLVSHFRKWLQRVSQKCPARPATAVLPALLLAGSSFAILLTAQVPASANAAGTATLNLPSGIQLIPAYGTGQLTGPARSRGAVVWSHGRSVDIEDQQAPTPLYMQRLRDAGWDVYRLNRLRRADTLPASSAALADASDWLKRQGYRQVTLAGQSFGAFISLMAAGSTDRIDAVIGTAPAAFGNFTEAYQSYRQNAHQLWPILNQVRAARVMLFFFHGDDFDPGGRGDQARTLLQSRGLVHQVIDQPARLSGHSAANTGLFLRRFGDCILAFAEKGPRGADSSCDYSWGTNPTDELVRAALSGSAQGASDPARQPGRDSDPARQFFGTWWGSYLNGREVALTVTGIKGDQVQADYIVGPGVEPQQHLERVRRTGRLRDGELVFDERGQNELRYSLRPDGQMTAIWQDAHGKGRLETVLLRLR